MCSYNMHTSPPPNRPDVYYAPLERQFGRILTPFEEFIHRQTTSGLLLMGAAILALIIANSALAPLYQHLLHMPITLHVGEWSIGYSAHHWVNDGLMALFFFVVGLELKREILVGELANLRRAALPVIAAIGGMLVPALIYYLLNPTGIEARGWAIPMATDIAFAVGALAILASRVPKSLITFLVALAIADDLGAVIIIALFYTEAISLGALGAAAAITLLLAGLNAAGVRRILPYFLLALPLWYALLLSGIHPTLAGVIGAFTVPARPKYDPEYFSSRTRDLLHRFDTSLKGDANTVTNDTLRSIVISIEHSAERVMAPLQRLEHIWHLPVAFLVIPIFALFNAGIPLGFGNMGEILSSPVLLGVVLGLVGGKFIGITSFCWIALRLRLAELPDETKFTQIAGVALLAGIGFTMSIFIAQLAFGDNEVLMFQAKLGILLASLVSGISGFIWLWHAGRKHG